MTFAGGQVLADWPGLRKQDLYEGRDLYPTADLRSVFKTLLIDHLELSPQHVEERVFTDSSAAKPMAVLLRQA